MCDCRKCEMLCDNELIKVIVQKSRSPFADDIWHFANGYKCLYNGEESLDIEDLPKRSCRLKTDNGMI